MHWLGLDGRWRVFPLREDIRDPGSPLSGQSHCQATAGPIADSVIDLADGRCRPTKRDAQCRIHDENIRAPESRALVQEKSRYLKRFRGVFRCQPWRPTTAVHRSGSSEAFTFCLQRDRSPPIVLCLGAEHQPTAGLAFLQVAAIDRSTEPIG